MKPGSLIQRSEPHRSGKRSGCLCGRTPRLIQSADASNFTPPEQLLLGVNFSRTSCTTFHCRDTTSSRSVTSSPSLASLLEPQQVQVVGPGTMAHALTVVPQHLDQRAAPAAEHKQMAIVRVALERLLHQQRQPVEALAHVGVAGRQPHPRPSRQRDHRRRPPLASVAIVVVSVAASTAPLIRSRDPFKLHLDQANSWQACRRGPRRNPHCRKARRRPRPAKQLPSPSI